MPYRRDWSRTGAGDLKRITAIAARIRNRLPADRQLSYRLDKETDFIEPKAVAQTGGEDPISQCGAYLSDRHEKAQRQC
jgi:hypothetical protein